ncbi:latent-transforming growth factor beta-binding protein 1-like isoform X1 [Biomphalaria glabrata]|uniref:Latent-transforming growth factor beta-binding protein 1-like isoform X1 n=1 Tax=Biomphalaria glabrata TaxID=6526 RepID=A0A9W2YBF3_BIOGL|nr:latent-transforming growth factor beta-binding protein 1-like isoform X1 [Biomphalaria glabrata]XP_055859921.1 latent-transforming growth factor beta-binding protein 1-like isoform X1 [Biomphalaria glabrata]XP_055859922.1 latent-transforming growth factor beta-binding protein 1-like isoform X1 [Biomphalaria glabrata]
MYQPKQVSLTLVVIALCFELYFICGCNNGYKPDSYGNCEDIDECTEDGKCNADVENCLNYLGGYVCLCKTGYARNDELVCQAPATRERTFVANPTSNPNVAMGFQGPTVQASSLLHCALLCSQSLRSCHSLLFNEANGQCTPGTWLYPSISALDPGLGVLHYNEGFYCDPFSNFIVSNYSNDKVCIFISDDVANYTDAKSLCRDLGALLYNVNSDLKWRQLMTKLDQVTDYWITHRNDPTICNSYRNYSIYHYTLNDCSNQFKFICEIE